MQKRVKTAHVIQYVLSIILIIFSSYVTSEDILLKMPLVYLPLVLWVIICGVFIWEFINKKNYARLIFILVSLLGTVFCWKVIDIYLANSFILIAAVLYLSVMLITAIKNSSFEKNQSVKVEGALPIGIFSKKHQEKNTISIYAAIFIGVVMGLISSRFDLPPIVVIVITFPVIFICVLTFTIMINPLSKASRKFFKDLNFEALEKTILDLSENNLHPDSRAYLNIFYTNYLATIDTNKSEELFATIERPVFKNYQVFYDLIDIIVAINKNDYELSCEKLNLFASNYPKQKRNILICDRNIKALLTDEEIYNVEKYFPITSEFAFSNASNANLLMHYYYRRNNIEKAKYYARFLVDKASSLTQYIKEANEILNV